MIKKIGHFLYIYFALSMVFFVVLISGCSSGTHSAAPVTSVEGYQADLKPKESSTTHKVKKGETLYAIAWRTNQDFKNLASRNGIQPPYNIFPGQVLSIKGNVIRKPIAVVSPSKPKWQPTKKVNKPTSTKKTVVQSPISKWKPVVKQQVTQVKNKPKKNKVISAPASKSNKKLAWSWPTRGKLVKRYSNSGSKQKGLSIAGPVGRKIIAAESGRVVYSGNGLRGYGNLIIIKHNDDYLSAYAYNQKLLVKEKQWVKEGQQIATMGNSGPTANIELYFEIRYRGKPVNPMRYLPKR